MRVSVVAMMLALTGCAEIQALRSGIAEHGATASDATLGTAVWTICNATPVGAIVRRFDTPAKMKTWQDLCSEIPEGV